MLTSPWGSAASATQQSKIRSGKVASSRTPSSSAPPALCRCRGRPRRVRIASVGPNVHRGNFARGIALAPQNWQREFKKWLGDERLRTFGAVPSQSLQEFMAASTIYPVLIIGYERVRAMVAGCSAHTRGRAEMDHDWRPAVSAGLGGPRKGRLWHCGVRRRPSHQERVHQDGAGSLPAAAGSEGG